MTDEAVGRWEETGWRTFHWEPWVAGLAPGARAMVLAEAVGWASSLWSSLHWPSIPATSRFGGADDHWVCPAVPPVRLKGRTELCVPVEAGGPGGRDGGTVALVSVSGGCPTDTWSEELAYLALVASLRSPSRPVPARVLGLWPDAGADRCVEIDAAQSGPGGRPCGGHHRRGGPLPPGRVGLTGRRPVVRPARTDDRTQRQNRALAALESGLPEAVSGTASTTSSCRGIL